MSLWNPITEPQDWVDFSGVRSPGIADIVGAGSPRSWDERESYAIAGAFVFYHGKKLSHFSVKLRLYTVEDWTIWWEKLEPLLSVLPRRGVGTKAFDVTHPYLAACKIRAAVVEDITQPEQTADGEWTIEIKMIEFHKPFIAAAKVDGAKATPADPEDAEIEQLNAQDAAKNAAFDALP